MAADQQQLEEFYIPLKQSEWRESHINDLFQLGGVEEDTFQTAKDILQNLISEHLNVDLDFKGSRGRVERDKIIQMFLQNTDGNGLSYIDATRGPKRWKNFEQLATKAMNSWIHKIQKNIRRTRGHSNGARKRSVQELGNDQSGEHSTSDAGLDSRGDDLSQQSLTEQRITDSPRTRKSRRLDTNRSLPFVSDSALAQPRIALGLTSTHVNSMKWLPLHGVSFMVADDTKIEHLPRFLLRAKQFISSDASSKPDSDLQDEDLDFDKFKSLCATHLGFDPEKHAIFWKLPVDQQNTAIIMLATTEESWRHGISSQQYKQIIEFRYNDISKVQQAANLDVPSLVSWLSPSRAPDENSDFYGFDSEQGDAEPAIENAIDQLVPDPAGESAEQRTKTLLEPTDLPPAAGSHTEPLADPSNSTTQSQSVGPDVSANKDQTTQPESLPDEIFNNELEIFWRTRLPKDWRQQFRKFQTLVDREEFMADCDNNTRLAKTGSMLRIALSREAETMSREDRLMKMPIVHKDQKLNWIFSHGGEESGSAKSDEQLKALADAGEDPYISMNEQLMNNVSDQFNKPFFQKICSAFRFEENILQNKRAQFHIPGTKKPLFAYQLYGVVWMWSRIYKTDRKVSGVFLADSPGFGKTIQSMAVLVLVSEMNFLWKKLQIDIEKADAAAPGHLHEESPDKAQCQAKNSTWMPCPCDPKQSVFGKKFDFKFQDGPALIIVPPNMITTWIKEIVDFVHLQGQERNSIRLFVAYELGTNDQKREYAHQGVYELNEDRAKLLGGDGNGSPASNKSRYWILTSHKALGTRLFPKLKDAGVNPLWSSVIIDEFHMNKGPDTEFNESLRSKITGQPFFIYLSATPIEKSPDDISAQLAAMESRYVKREHKKATTRNSRGEFRWRWCEKVSQQVQNDMWYLTPMRVKQNSSILTKAQNAKDIENYSGPPIEKDALDNAMSESRYLFKAVMIQRSPRSTWFGRPCLDMPWLRMFDVPVLLSPAQQQYVDDSIRDAEQSMIEKLDAAKASWDKKHGKSANPDVPRPKQITDKHFKDAGRYARIVAVFPALAPFVKEEYRKQLEAKKRANDFGAKMAEEIYKQGKSHWLYPHIEEIYNEAPKMKMLVEALQNELPKFLDMDGDPRKVLIFAFSPFVCALVYMCLILYLGLDLGWYATDLSNEKRADLAKAYQESRPGDDNYVLGLIGVPDVLGVGLTLTKGSVTFNLSPEFTLKAEIQMYGRQNRTSIVQKEPTTFAFRFIVQGHAVEETIMLRQTNRNAIQEMTKKKDSESWSQLKKATKKSQTQHKLVDSGFGILDMEEAI